MLPPLIEAPSAVGPAFAWALPLEAASGQHAAPEPTRTSTHAGLPAPPATARGRCNRQRVKEKESKCRRRNKHGEVIKEYTSRLKQGRVLQVFKLSCLKEALRRDPESAQFLSRRDHRIGTTGLAVPAKMGVESRLAEIKDHKVKERMVLLESGTES